MGDTCNRNLSLRYSPVVPLILPSHLIAHVPQQQLGGQSHFFVFILFFTQNFGFDGGTFKIKAHGKLLGLSFLLGFIISLGKIMGRLSVFLFPVSSQRISSNLQLSVRNEKSIRYQKLLNTYPLSVSYRPE